MRYLFILNPAAGKQDCTVQLIPQLQQAAVRPVHPASAASRGFGHAAGQPRQR